MCVCVCVCMCVSVVRACMQAPASTTQDAGRGDAEEGWKKRQRDSWEARDVGKKV